MSSEINSWKNPAKLLTSIGIAGIGDFIYLVVINILVFQMTGSAAAVAGLWIIGPAVNILTKFWTGSFIDYRSKRKVMIGTYWMRALGIALLPLAPNILMIYAILVFLSGAKAFFGPSSMTYTTMLIPKEKRKRFNAIRSFTFSGAFIIGPAAGGALLLITSMEVTLWLNAALFITAAFLLKLLPEKEKIVKENIPDLTVSQVKKDFTAVIAFMKHHRYVVGVYFGFIVIMVFTFAMDAQEVVFTQDTIGLTETEYSYLISITGIGSAAGGLLLSVFSAKFPLRYMIVIGLFMTAAGYVIYAFSWSFYSIMTGFLLLGFFLVFLNAGMTTFYQNNIPVSVMGRVTSIIQLMQSVLQIVIILLIGIIADLVNLRITIAALSLIMLAASIVYPFIIFRKGKAARYEEETYSGDTKAVL
ncbi:MFS transporter [Alkalicoccus halolimnae]|uniref:MFS transporter n=1 Tax=Alkalicoccus halolimnae TaxID=1667239 RepID=A0A5C7F7K5_9BACI|nr:MFS transporter [Alkalicoccus halolimnae]TXF85378.1 MFS transporter [Alkalicoccus halolimnae]